MRMILIDGPDTHAHCTNCGADLSVVRISACCQAPTPNAFTESPKSDAFLAGYAWMGRRCDSVLSARSHNLSEREIPARFGETHGLTMSQAAGWLLEAWTAGSIPETAREHFLCGEPAAAFRTLLSDPVTTLSGLSDFAAGAGQRQDEVGAILKGAERTAEAYAIAGILAPTGKEFGWEAARCVHTGWNTARVPSEIMKIFFRGDALRGLAALSAYDTVHPLGFRDGVEAMTDLIGGSFDALRPRHRDPKTLVQAYDAGHHDATASDLAAVNAARTALLNTKGG